MDIPTTTPAWTPLALVPLVGIGATVFMDAWLLALARLGVPSSSFALVGRWVAHVAAGRLVHASMAKAAPVRGELGLGWLTHYVVGVVYAGLLVALTGIGWVREPRLLPALAFGLGTVVVPWFVMQPAMGAGVAGSRTPSPAASRVRSLANHAAFGIGLYASAVLLARIG